MTLSSITTTLHAGSHADAPLHVTPGAPSIDAVPLETWIGPCQVVEARVGARGDGSASRTSPSRRRRRGSS